MSNEPLVLGMDTSADACSAALVKGGQLIGIKHEIQERGQAERLFPLLHELLAKVNKEWNDIDIIAVITGPGNNTGIRLAVAAGRGLSLSLEIPCIGVSAFEAVSLDSNQPCLAMITAPQERAHTQLMPTGEPKYCKLTDLSLPPKNTVVIGDQVAKTSAASWGCKWGEPKYFSGEAAARIAETKSLKDFELPIPYYQKPSS